MLHLQKAIYHIGVLIWLSPVYVLAQVTGDSGVPTLRNPLKAGNDTLYALITNFLQNVVLPVGAVICVLAIIYAGFLFVTASGNETKLETAKRALTYALIGTAILLGSVVIAKGIEATIKQVAPITTS